MGRTTGNRSTEDWIESLASAILVHFLPLEIPMLASSPSLVISSRRLVLSVAAGFAVVALAPTPALTHDGVAHAATIKAFPAKFVK